MVPAEGAGQVSAAKCWGVGLGRTGTVSFCEALHMLGYSTVGHNPLFEELRECPGSFRRGASVSRSGGGCVGRCDRFTFCTVRRLVV